MKTILLFVFLVLGCSAAELTVLNKSQWFAQVHVGVSSWPGTTRILGVAPHSSAKLDLGSISVGSGVYCYAMLSDGASDIIDGDGTYNYVEGAQVIFDIQDAAMFIYGNVTPVLPSASGGGSALPELNADHIEAFRLGLFFVIGCGLSVLLVALVRRIGRQDHRP